jgi:hypothetical protein
MIFQPNALRFCPSGLQFGQPVVMNNLRFYNTWQIKLGQPFSKNKNRRLAGKSGLVFVEIKCRKL